MNEAKRKRLAETGYQSTTVSDFLGLSTEQSELIEIKLAFTYALRKKRTASGLSQTELAEKIGSSQSRIAKMEAGDPHVSLDLMIRALLAMDMTRGELANAILGQMSQPLPIPMTQVSHLEMKGTMGHYKFDISPKHPAPTGYSTNKKIPDVQVG